MSGIAAFPKTLDELGVAAQKISTGGVHDWGLPGTKEASLISPPRRRRRARWRWPAIRLPPGQ